VRSLYFDSPDRRCYHEKLDGLAERFKLRIRGYLIDDRNPSNVRFEIKRRQNLKTGKQCSWLSTSTLHGFMRSILERRMPEHRFLAESPALATFFHLHRLFDLQPVVNVEFHRSAYAGRLDRDLRVTIDDHLTAWPARNLLDHRPQAQVVTDRTSILEIKLNAAMPIWLDRLIAKYGLRPQAVSKYVLGARRFLGDLPLD